MRTPRLVSMVSSRLPERIRDGLRRWWHSVLVLLPTAARLPPVEVDLRRWVPCWLLRICAALLALGSAALVITGGFGWTVVVALALLILVRPAAPGAVALAVVLGFSLLQGGARAWGVTGPLLLLGLHLCVALCVLLGTTGWAARVELAVLARPGPRFVVIQLIAQLLGVVGALITGRELSWPWLPVVAALCISLLAYVWLPRIAVRPEPAPSPTVRTIGSAARRWGDE